LDTFIGYENTIKERRHSKYNNHIIKKAESVSHGEVK
jgi:hypothetical protein